MNVTCINEESETLNSFQFDPTPAMSTYLLGFCVGEYESITMKSNQGIPITIYAPKEEINHVQFALETATKSIDFFSSFFNVPYSLPKCDFVSSPAMIGGAMENWGLIIHKSTLLVFDEEESTVMSKLNIALTIAHECAHQWFGNLVTVNWWSQLWLKEGFAMLMGCVFCNKTDISLWGEERPLCSKYHFQPINETKSNFDQNNVSLPQIDIEYKIN